MIYNGIDYNLSKVFTGKSNRLSSKPDQEQLKIIYELTKFYPNDLNKSTKDKNLDLKVRCYIVKNNILNEQLLCKNCGKNYVKFNSPSKGFVTYCCPKCANTSKEVLDSVHKTNLKKYGTKESLASEHNKKLKKETCLKKYGHTNILCSDYVKESNLKKFGTENVSEAVEIKEKVKNTNLENFGVEYVSQLPIIKEKIKNTNLKKYGVNSISQKHIKNYENYNKEYIINNFLDKNNHIKLKEMMEYYNITQTSVHKKFKDFEILFNSRSTSRAETEIFDMIKGSIQSDKLLIGKELDIVNHESKFAIEYDGLMFHSHGISKYSMFNNPKEKRNRHVQKTDLCEEKGYQLFHIFENEWKDPVKQKIWKSMLKSKLYQTKRIYARKCDIKEVSSKTAVEFLKNNHLQGSCFSKINYGLYYENDLVSLMTFGISRFSKKYEYELLRFCNLINTTVVGGASRLMKHFEKTIRPKSIVSYANRRWSTGNLYDAIGFTFSHVAKPNYFYFKNGSYTLESRNKYQKHKLHRVLNIFDPSHTETTNMYNNNYRKIYDAGNLIYYKNYEEK